MEFGKILSPLLPIEFPSSLIPTFNFFSRCPKERNLLIAEPDVLSFDLRDLKLKPPSFLILASDGLWDAFTNEEAARFVRWRLNEPHLGARSLAQQAYKRGSVDNITVLIVNLTELT